MKSNVFLITGNAGQGKTTIATNIAMALAQYGHDTLLLDSDLRTPKINFHFGKNLPERSIQDVLADRIKLEEAVYQHPSGLKILFSSPAQHMIEHPSKLLKDIKRLANIIIIDTPTYDLEWYKQNLQSVLVTHSDFPSVLEIIKLTKHLPKTQGIIINNAKSEHYELSPGNVNSITNKKIIGVLMAEKQIKATHKIGEPIVESHADLATTKTIRAIAANLMNQNYLSPLK